MRKNLLEIDMGFFVSNHVTSFSCDCCPVNGAWYQDFSVTITRIYFVHSGWAKIYNGFKEYTLKPRYMYLFPQYNDMQTIDSENFDHTFFILWDHIL